MRLASLKQGRDGRLVLVSRDGQRCVDAAPIAATLQRALDDWPACVAALTALAERLERGTAAGAFAFAPEQCAAPLPRAYQWADGSAYLSHVERVRRARGADLPDSLRHDPLMYQGGSDTLLGPCDPIAVADEDWGIDFEAEVAVITGDVTMGTSANDAGAHIRLITLVNDVSLRKLVPAELAKGFGFFQSKPSSALAPLAVTPDELGEAWDGARLHGRLLSSINGRPFGRPDAGVGMHFGFDRLLAHAARTRRLGAGSLIGSGTVSNDDAEAGCSCIVEQRILETLRYGAPRTPFLRFGDRVRIEMLDGSGRSLFGAIDQTVVRADAAL
jgi:fumarylacetoacetate (FAA) hydrolase